jgi:bifunctional DNA-binding transcriptional regulator/antitoxin component of YhaV-PrlF toxin-antitoxin module
MPKTVSAEAHLRARNQITIPDCIVRAAGIEPGETFVVEVEPDDGDTLRLRPFLPGGVLRPLEK